MIPKAAGFALDSDDGERFVFGEGTVLIKVSAAETRGAFTIWEELPPLLDTPLHVHEREDELIHVLDGEHIFQCGDTEFNVGPGGIVFLPRGVPHAHRRVVPRVGRFLVLVSPAGFEGFFRMLAEAECAGELGPEAYAAASERYGISWMA